MAEGNDIDNHRVARSDEGGDDLESLLDSALGDFTELPKQKRSETKAEVKPNSVDTREDEAEQIWSDMIKEALQVDPRDLLQQGNNEGNNFAQDFSKIAEAAAKVIQGDCPTNFEEIMSETLRNLNESSESIQNQFGNPEELANLFQELGLNGTGMSGESSMEDIPPFMQSIMQSFLSKEILYPSIKDFVERYPQWIEEHKSSLSQDEYDNYCKQLNLMKKVVEEFESESDSDSEDVKKQRFQRIIGYMQQMQALGHPPAELIGSDAPLDGAPSLPPGVDPNQCCTM